MKLGYLVLDLFSGGGGLTEGFIRHSFDFVAHIEADHYAVKTLETRLLFHDLYNRKKPELYDLYYSGRISRDEFLDRSGELNLKKHCILNKELSDSTMESAISEIKGILKSNFNRSTVDVIIGGPPCQAYSLVGRGKDKFAMKNDPRNYLYQHYLDFLKKFQPEIFIFENVPGLISAKNGLIYKNFIHECSEIGYHLDEKAHLLDASDFGVLQNRKRIIFIGWKKEYSLEYPEFTANKSNKNVWALLNDLPILQAGEGCDDLQPYRKTRPSSYLKEMNIRNGVKGIRHHIAKSHNERDREIYRIAIKRWNELEKRLNYNELPEDLKTHRNREAFLDRFKVVSGSSHSHSILAHLGKDGHYFIHPDINQARSLTIREAARIQSFPDNYLFEGSRYSKYVQIGNAVPPLMAEGIASEIKNMLQKI